MKWLIDSIALIYITTLKWYNNRSVSRLFNFTTYKNCLFLNFQCADLFQFFFSRKNFELFSRSRVYSYLQKTCVCVYTTFYFQKQIFALRKFINLNTKVVRGCLLLLFLFLLFSSYFSHASFPGIAVTKINISTSENSQIRNIR